MYHVNVDIQNILCDRNRSFNMFYVMFYKICVDAI